MLPYFGLLMSVVLALYFRNDGIRMRHPLPPVETVFWVALLTVLIGWRHLVGADWGAYAQYVVRNTGIGILEVLKKDEPGFNLLNWCVAELGGGNHSANFVGALIFSVGLLAFCNRQPVPRLALVIAIPYLVTVVAMGYVRQAVAIGFFFLAINELQRKRVIGYLAWIAVAATFHKTAMIVAPLALVIPQRNRLVSAAVVSIAVIAMYQQFLSSSVEHFYDNYWAAEYNSQGALVRILLNALPAIIFLIFRKRFALGAEVRSFWTWMSFSALGLLVLLSVASSTTAVDRIGLYLIPLQLFVWSRLPLAFGSSSPRDYSHWQAGVVVMCASIQAVWLIFAAHASYWLPYQFYPFVWMRSIASA